MVIPHYHKTTKREAPKMAEKYLTMRIDETLHMEFKIRAIKEGMTLIEALNEAVQNWLDDKLDQETAALKAGTVKAGCRVSVVTPNESGKTSVVIPVLGLSFMTAFPGAQVVSTAGVERQINPPGAMSVKS